MKPNTVMPEDCRSDARDEDRAIDAILTAARSAWKAGIARDEVIARASEQRLAARSGRREASDASRGFRWTPLRDALPVAACLALLILGGAALRRSGSSAPESIRAEAPVPAIETGSDPSAGAVATHEVEPAASAPAPGAIEVEPSKPAAPKPPPTVSAAPAAPASAPRVARTTETLPPLPPPEPPAEGPARKRRATDQAMRVRIDRKALNIAVSEMASGSTSKAHDTLRLLAAHGDSALAYEATNALARSLGDPHAQLAAWDELLRRPLDEPYHTRAQAARARVLAGIERREATPPPAPPAPPAPPLVDRRPRGRVVAPTFDPPAPSPLRAQPVPSGRRSNERR